MGPLFQQDYRMTRAGEFLDHDASGRAGANNDKINILMDVPDKHPGYTHIAFRVASINDTIDTLKENEIEIRQGPVDFGDGHLSVFIRDPDLNVVELRGRGQGASTVKNAKLYVPEN